VRYRRKAPLAALGRCSMGCEFRKYRHALRDLRRVLLCPAKSRRRINGRLVRLEVRP